MTATLLIAAHGTKSDDGTATTRTLVDAIAAQRPHVPVELCFLDVASPSLAEALDTLAAADVVIVGDFNDYPNEPAMKTALREIAQIHTGDFRLTPSQNLSIAGVTLESAVAINDLGAIAANGSDNHAYVLIPANAPGGVRVNRPEVCGYQRTG